MFLSYTFGRRQSESKRRRIIVERLRTNAAINYSLSCKNSIEDKTKCPSYFKDRSSRTIAFLQISVLPAFTIIPFKSGNCSSKFEMTIDKCTAKYRLTGSTRNPVMLIYMNWQLIFDDRIIRSRNSRTSEVQEVRFEILISNIFILRITGNLDSLSFASKNDSL